MESRPDRVLSVHPVWHVPAESQPVSVGALHDRRYQLGLDRTVDFDLRVLELVVSIDRRPSRFFGVDQNSGRGGKRARTVKKSGGNDSGSSRLAQVVALSELS